MKRLIIFIICSVCLLTVSVPIAGAVDQPDWAKKASEGESPLSEEASPEDLLTNIIQIIAVIFGGLFILMMLIGSIIYMTSADGPRKDTGKNIMTLAIVAAVIGLLTGVVWLFLRENIGSGGSSNNTNQGTEI